jgi:NADH-quinone oxidoreductase subunit G
MAGGDLTAQVGVGQGTNFSEMGPETSILVVACDLEEEAPIWWLRVKQAAGRGANLIVANPRRTRLDRYASHRLRYPYGAEAAIVLAMLNTLSAKRPNLPESVQSLLRSPDLQAAARTFSESENAVVIFGSEGTGLASSRALAQACANLLVATGHVGRANNGLLGVWQRANDQGAWDMGFQPVEDLPGAMRAARTLYVVAADPAGDDPSLAESADFMVVQELYLTKTAKLADVVLPVQAFTEREGSFTSGERRVQRYYPALPEPAGSFADFAVSARIAKRLDIALEGRFGAKVMDQIARQVPDYAGVSFTRLAEVREQWPLIGRDGLYYGGTSYENSQGLGLQLAPAVQRGEPFSLAWAQPPEIAAPLDGLLAVPVTRLYDRGQTLLPSTLLHQRIPDPFVVLSKADASELGASEGALLQVSLNGSAVIATARVDKDLPAGVVLVPRSMGIPIDGPGAVRIQVAEPAIA